MNSGKPFCLWTPRVGIASSFDSWTTIESDEIPVSEGYFVRMERASQDRGSGFGGVMITDELKTPLGIIVAGS